MSAEILSAIIGGGAELLGGILGNKSNAKQADKAMAFENSQAERQMAFQREMASTEYQRAVEDMRKAGINPILAAKGGNSSPAGASGSGNVAHQENVLAGTTAALKSKYEMELTKEMVNTERTKQNLNSANAQAAAGYVGIPGFAKVSLGQAKDLVKKAADKTGFTGVWNGAVSKAKANIEASNQTRSLVNHQTRFSARPTPPILPQPA